MTSVSTVALDTLKQFRQIASILQVYYISHKRGVEQTTYIYKSTYQRNQTSYQSTSYDC